MSPTSRAILIFRRQGKILANVARKTVRHVVLRITWARAMARGVPSPAGAGPRGRRARRFPGGPERCSAPAPKRPGQAAPPRGRAAARAGRAASSSRAAPRRGALSRGASGSPHPLPYSRRPRSRRERGKGLPRAG